MKELLKPIIIAGPCAAESREQILESAKMAEAREINVVRASLWKPRTKPGFEGVGTEGIEWLEQISDRGLIPATEVMTAQNAHAVTDRFAGQLGRSVLIWIGSRNQNHLIQREIGRVTKGERKVLLLIKNQPWASVDHWLGIIDHVVSGGADPSQLILCHRGFAPGTNGYRNEPDFELAMRVKELSGLPMLVDPSHIGGTRENVMKIAREASCFKQNGVSFDGLMVEIHPNPDKALTDSDQQLSWEQLDKLRLDEAFKGWG